jgi:hypothetical protein
MSKTIIKVPKVPKSRDISFMLPKVCALCAEPIRGTVCYEGKAALHTWCFAYGEMPLNILDELDDHYWHDHD